MAYRSIRPKYLLDTNVVSDIVRNEPSVNDRFSRLRRELLRVSAVTIKEIEYGRRHRPEAARQFDAAIDAFMEDVRWIAFQRREALVTGQLRAVLARLGTPIGPFDVMIAGTALARNLILVTANTREFSRVPKLKLENWRTPVCGVRESSAARDYYRAQARLSVH